MKHNLQTIAYIVLTLMIGGNAYADTATRSFGAKKTNLGVQNLNRKTALIIGNADYRTARLKNPVRDAQDIAQALKKVGFNVIFKKNQSQNQMRLAIRDFGKLLQSGGLGLFYYAGHGVQVKGENYLIPIGSDIQEEDEVPYQSINLSSVLGKMETAKNNMNVVILDACRDNPFARSSRGGPKGLALTEGPKGTLIAYSTQPGATASDGDGANGLYTKYLLKNILQPGLTIEQVFKRVRTQVIKESGSKQVPWELSSLTGDDFYFSGQGTAPIQHVAMLPPTTPIYPTETDNTRFPPSTNNYPGVIIQPEPIGSNTLFGPLMVSGPSSNNQSRGLNSHSFDSTSKKIVISFNVNNLPKNTLLTGVWSDIGRNTKLETLFEVSKSENGQVDFTLKKPSLADFAQGNYLFTVYLNSNSIGSVEFEIMK